MLSYFSSSPVLHTNPGLRQPEKMLDNTALASGCRAAGSELKMLLGPYPGSPPADQPGLDAASGCRETEFTIHFLQY